MGEIGQQLNGGFPKKANLNITMSHCENSVRFIPCYVNDVGFKFAFFGNREPVDKSHPFKFN